MHRYVYSVAARKPEHGPIVRYCQHGRKWHTSHLGAAFCRSRVKRVTKDKTLTWYVIDERKKAGLGPAPF